MHHSSLCELDVVGSHARQLVILMNTGQATEITDKSRPQETDRLSKRLDGISVAFETKDRCRTWVVGGKRYIIHRVENAERWRSPMESQGNGLEIVNLVNATQAV